LATPFANNLQSHATSNVANVSQIAALAAVPGEAFGTPGYLRLSYALSDADLAEGVTRIQRCWRRRSSPRRV